MAAHSTHTTPCQNESWIQDIIVTENYSPPLSRLNLSAYLILSGTHAHVYLLTYTIVHILKMHARTFETMDSEINGKKACNSNGF